MTKVWPDVSDLPDPNDEIRSKCRALRCIPGEIAPNVLVPGDPARANKIASNWLTDSRLVMVQREFHSYTGLYNNVPISVISPWLRTKILSALIIVDNLWAITRVVLFLVKFIIAF